jgi:hypothetical protein
MRFGAGDERFFAETARTAFTVGCCRELDEGGSKVVQSVARRLSRVSELP